MPSAALPDLTDQPIRMVRISKSFVGTNAVREIDLDINAGEIHAIVGENGAGEVHPDEGARGQLFRLLGRHPR